MKRNDFSHTSALFLMVVVLLGAAFVRLDDLAGTPPGAAFDATWDTADALRISQCIPFPADFGERPEPLHRFVLATWFRWAGASEFTARLFHVLADIFTVALIYQAGLAVYLGRPWRRLGAVVAAGTLAAMISHLFLSRIPYRVIFIPPVVAAALILLMRAHRSRRARTWAAGAFAAGFAIHVYLAGIAALAWLVGVVVHQVLVQKEKRIGWRNTLAVIGGVIPPLAAWLLLIWLIPGLLFRMGNASGKGSLITRTITGFWEAIREFVLTGFPRPLFNTQTTPLLNPALAVLTMVGVIYALRRWRQADGAFVLGGLVVFIFPAALSLDGGHPARLIGTSPFLAVLAGSGAAWVAQFVSMRWHRWRVSVIPVFRFAVTALIVVSLALSLNAFRATFADPARYDPPDYWLNIPHNYTIALYEALEALLKVDQPTYVPVGVLDSALGYFMLQRDAYPNVTTWAHYGLHELPAGQIFYPAYAYLHIPTPDSYPLQALLLPQEKTIVILPAMTDTSPVIKKPHGEGVRTIASPYGWDVAYIAPRAASALPGVQESASPASIGNGLELINPPEPFLLQAGKPISVVLNWKVTAPQPTDIYSVAQVIDPNLNAVMSSDQHVLPYLYPSARWQPGDIIPDVHTLDTPDALPDAIYRWGVGAYVPPGQDRLPVVSAEYPLSVVDNLWLWGAGRTTPPPQSPSVSDMTALDAQLGDSIRLVGYQIDRGDSTWSVNLYWRTSALPEGDYVLFVHAMKDGNLLTQADERPNGGAIPTWSWWPGEIVSTTITLTLPDKASLPDTLYVGMYNYPSLERLSVVQDGVLSEDNRVLLWSQSK